MLRVMTNGLVLYRFENLDVCCGIQHGVFTRLGGVSAKPFDSLNVGATVGDDLKNVHVNRERMAQAMGVQGKDTYTTWQVHGADVLVVRGNRPQPWPPEQADAIITTECGRPLVMRFADCVPLIFCDPVRHVIALAHAGWRGTVMGVGPTTVETMRDAFGCRPEDIVVGIGPSIGPCCYQVGPEVVSQVRGAFSSVDGLIHRHDRNGCKPYFDLWAANRRALEDVGVRQIELAGMCTACHTHEFYSHRADQGKTGRFGVLIVIGGEGTL